MNGERLSDWEAYSAKIKSLNLPEVWFCDDFDKESGEKNTAEIKSELEAHRNGRQAVIALDDRRTIAAIQPDRLIGRTAEESGVSKDYCIRFE